MIWCIWNEFLGIETEVNFCTSFDVANQSKKYDLYINVFHQGLEVMLMQKGKVIVYTSQQLKDF